MLKVSELFKSIDGEGIRTGYPCVFIRLHGCNLNCSYCDSRYACDGDDYTLMDLHEILDKVKSFNIPRITITGGEPLIHDESYELVELLLQNYFEVNIETNGSIDLSKLYTIPYRSGMIVTMDWKSGSSGMSDKMINSNLRLLGFQDVLKFVVGSDQDLLQMKSVLDNNKIQCQVFVSPVYGAIDPKHIVEFLLDQNLVEVRMQLQLHKQIWGPTERGV